MERFRNKYSIAAMCLVFEVSRSGYMIPFCSSPFEKAAFDSTRVKFRPQFAGETALFPVSANRKNILQCTLVFCAVLRPACKRLDRLSGVLRGIRRTRVLRQALRVFLLSLLQSRAIPAALFRLILRPLFGENKVEGRNEYQR